VELEDDFTALDFVVEQDVLDEEGFFMVDDEGFIVLVEETFLEEQGVLVGTIFLVDEGVGEGFFVELIALELDLHGVLLGVEVTPRGTSVSVDVQTVVSVVLDACQLPYYAQKGIAYTVSNTVVGSAVKVVVPVVVVSDSVSKKVEVSVDVSSIVDTDVETSVAVVVTVTVEISSSEEQYGVADGRAFRASTTGAMSVHSDAGAGTRVS
jgi:hypothetical protein